MVNLRLRLSFEWTDAGRFVAVWSRQVGLTGIKKPPCGGFFIAIGVGLTYRHAWNQRTRHWFWSGAVYRA